MSKAIQFWYDILHLLLPPSLYLITYQAKHRYRCGSTTTAYTSSRPALCINDTTMTTSFFTSETSHIRVRRSIVHEFAVTAEQGHHLSGLGNCVGSEKGSARALLISLSKRALRTTRSEDAGIQ
jgi:predicted metalloprotease